MSHILVIDDEKCVSELICEALTKFGHIVETTTDGLHGLRLFKNGSFDLVITDMCMPNIDGPSVVRNIRRSNRPNTPIIGISGTPLMFNKTDCDSFLTKPFSLLKLIKTVKDSLIESDSAAPSRTRFSAPFEAQTV